MAADIIPKVMALPSGDCPDWLLVRCVQVIAAGMYHDPRMCLATLAGRSTAETPNFVQEFFKVWIGTLPMHKTYCDIKTSSVALSTLMMLPLSELPAAVASGMAALLSENVKLFSKLEALATEDGDDDDDDDDDGDDDDDDEDDDDDDDDDDGDYDDDDDEDFTVGDHEDAVNPEDSAIAAVRMLAHPPRAPKRFTQLATHRRIARHRTPPHAAACRRSANSGTHRIFGSSARRSLWMTTIRWTTWSP